MGNEFKGMLLGEGLKFGLVVSRFNDFVTSKLLEGAMDGLGRHGVKEQDIDIVRVPGAFEIPLVASRLAKSDKYDAVICLGVIIRGDTPHYEYVATTVNKGIAKVALKTGLSVINGIITADSLEQAIERAGSKMGNKGYQAAAHAIEMANLMKQLD